MRTRLAEQRVHRVGVEDLGSPVKVEAAVRWRLGGRVGEGSGAEGAIPFPTPEEAAAHAWTDEDRALVADRVDTQLTGSPATVTARLRQLQEATGADELVITTITHDHADRVRSYELLAEHWNR
ncbi:hypothetical protein VA596_23895 [Amycolatopsis sp., V23-08]|uniref:Luciferase-like monooxygenase n=1 Tax=Amycolatopsis heterodermiae TaxID=3110235 RepID=A0ABU5RAF3_9PSEU|nr:hypothetical protein [Amycolatopsis sp., V23-08]MEA5362599.1 hypothetical protein [Amycolatopsis sp., V23-08]